MSEIKPVRNTDVDEGAGDYLSRRETRSRRRADRRAGGGRRIGGMLLIALGVLFLLQNAGYLTAFSNWWALFLLLPAVSMFIAAVGAYRRYAGLSAEVTGPFLGGLLFLGLTLVLLLDLNFAWLWPMFLIAAGLLLLGRTLVDRPAQ